MKDYFGTELKIGDIVAYAHTGYQSIYKGLRKGTIVSSKNCFGQCRLELTNEDGTLVKADRSCVKIGEGDLQ